MKTLVSINQRTYYGRQRKIGERFRASNADAKILCAVGYAREAPPEAPPPEPKKRQYRRRDMEAELPTPELPKLPESED